MLTVKQTDLVSDQAGVAATHDPKLVNAWGTVITSSGFAWIAANGSGSAEILRRQWRAERKHLSAGATKREPRRRRPGRSKNTDQTRFDGDKFIFVTEDGTVDGWQSGTAAENRFTSCEGAVYKGAALACGGQLFATDFHNGRVDVFDSSYQQKVTSGAFTDANLPSGFAPFNVFARNDVLIVTYAKQDADKHDDVAGAGNGFVDAYDCSGQLMQRVITRGELNSPWGVAVGTMCDSPDQLFIGNFGDGHINTYSLEMSGSAINVAHQGQLQNKAIVARWSSTVCGRSSSAALVAFRHAPIVLHCRPR